MNTQPEVVENIGSTNHRHKKIQPILQKKKVGRKMKMEYRSAKRPEILFVFKISSDLRHYHKISII